MHDVVIWYIWPPAKLDDMRSRILLFIRTTGTRVEIIGVVIKPGKQKTFSENNVSASDSPESPQPSEGTKAQDGPSSSWCIERCPYPCCLQYPPPFLSVLARDAGMSCWISLAMGRFLNLGSKFAWSQVLLKNSFRCRI